MNSRVVFSMEKKSLGVVEKILLGISQKCPAELICVDSKVLLDLVKRKYRSRGRSVARGRLKVEVVELLEK